MHSANSDGRSRLLIVVVIPPLPKCVPFGKAKYGRKFAREGLKREIVCGILNVSAAWDRLAEKHTFLQVEPVIPAVYDRVTP